MADLSTCPPLTRSSIQAAHARIRSHIHRTPVLTNSTLNDLASTPQTPSALIGTPWEGQRPAHPRMKFFFKCENFQRIGAFKSRGAFNALSRLSKEELKRGVVTHSSGNHAQALALAARTHGIPAYIVMPTISTPSKIAATKSYGAEVIFSGSTSEEREEVVRKVQARTGAILVPPYDHPDIILGQGTLALEMEEQVRDLVREDPALSVHYEEAQTSGLTDCSVNGNANVKGNGEIKRIQEGQGQAVQPNGHNHDDHSSTKQQSQQSEPPPFHLNALLAPTGGGGLLSGLSIAHHPTPTLLFGAEPSFQNAHDLVRALSRTPPQHIPSVSTLTIADGLRTPIGLHPWNLVSDKEYVEGAYAVSEMEIKKAMRLVVERMKVLVEPSAVVGLAVALFHEGFRRRVEREGNGRGEGKCKKGGWDVGIVLSGGNTTIEALGDLFSAEEN